VEQHLLIKGLEEWLLLRKEELDGFATLALELDLFLVHCKIILIKYNIKINLQN
jgi:hypothetical protein